ncbi:MAG TPA: hypothetical protein VEJ63_14410 [Planctomycetota bacterium]|nr:hypothetical protein [Planctomycetota bacterium]
MARKKSAFDRVKAHLSKGNDVPPSPQIADDVEIMVRRCNEVRSLGREYGEIELSPYMASLLRISRSAPLSAPAVNAAAAASV